jgi:hypothetical protein
MSFVCKCIVSVSFVTLVSTRLPSGVPNKHNTTVQNDVWSRCTAHLRNKDTLKMMKESIYNRRHLHTCVFFSSDVV